MSRRESLFGTGKKKFVYFISIFLVSILILGGAMYFVPKGRQLLFGNGRGGGLRSSAEFEVGGKIDGFVFADVEGDHPNAYALTYLKSKRIIKGYEDNTFRPDDLIKRSEVVKLVVGGQHIYPHMVVYSNCFNDISNEWFAPYVCFAKKRSWVSGSDDENFNPYDNIKGAEVLKIIMEAYGVEVSFDTDEEGNILTDDPWWNPYIEVAEEFKWIETDGENVFDPQREMTRAEVVEILFRVMLTERIE